MIIRVKALKWVNTEESEWHRVFALLPVRMVNMWIWLEFLERRFIANGLDWAVEYRLSLTGEDVI